MDPMHRTRLVTVALFVITLWTSAVEAGAAEACETVNSGRCKLSLTTGIEMAYLEIGPATGKPVILIHGLTDNVRSWSLSMESLHKLNPGLHIMAIDLRGHGQSSMPDVARCAPAPEECFRPEDFAADLEAFMDAKEIDKAALVGHSLGSFIVQEFAIRHPDRISHAILVATAASSVGNVALTDYVLKEPIEGSWRKSLEEKGKSYPIDFYSLTPTDADPNVEEWLAKSWVVDPTADPDFLSPYIPETAKVRLGTWIGATKALLAQDNTKRLETLSVPTLVLWATQDSIFLARDQEVIKASLEIAANKSGRPMFYKEYGVTPLPASGAQETDVGHNIQWSAFEAVAKDIQTFIETEAPTADLVRSESATNVRKLVIEPNKAVVERIGG